jgi:hypothetical protein
MYQDWNRERAVVASPAVASCSACNPRLESRLARRRKIDRELRFIKRSIQHEYHWYELVVQTLASYPMTPKQHLPQLGLHRNGWVGPIVAITAFGRTFLLLLWKFNIK